MLGMKLRLCRKHKCRFINKINLFCDSSLGHHVFAGHRQMSAKSVTDDHADPSVIMSNDPAVTVHGINSSVFI